MTDLLSVCRLPIDKLTSLKYDQMAIGPVQAAAYLTSGNFILKLGFVYNLLTFQPSDPMIYDDILMIFHDMS